ncbi:hypothetical protein MTYP_02402 [Methylophilaceae bacterium]|nr:hypothetical protein MTYP_02402 [Methylophilaceae bacterium]
MLSCRQASELVSQSLDRPLNLRERIAVRFHLLICTACTRFSRQLALMHAAIKKLASETEQNESLQLSRQVRDRITRALESGSE